MYLKQDFVFKSLSFHFKRRTFSSWLNLMHFSLWGIRIISVVSNKNSPMMFCSDFFSCFGKDNLAIKTKSVYIGEFENSRRILRMKNAATFCTFFVIGLWSVFIQNSFHSLSRIRLRFGNAAMLLPGLQRTMEGKLRSLIGKMSDPKVVKTGSPCQDS